MSTEERDKAAIEAFPANITYPMGVKRDHNAAARVAFTIGWDARGQVTPDREAIQSALFAADWYSSNKWEDSGRLAATVLALFNEKGNE